MNTTMNRSNNSTNNNYALGERFEDFWHRTIRISQTGQIPRPRLRLQDALTGIANTQNPLYERLRFTIRYTIFNVSELDALIYAGLHKLTYC